MLLPENEPNYSAVHPEAEALIRAVARAVIRRVQTENPGCRGIALRSKVAAANPFPSFQVVIQVIWQEETEWALRGCGINVN